MSPLSQGDPPNIPVLETRGKVFRLDAIPQLLDDRSDPDFRETYGMLARRASGLDVALTHIQLATLDLSEAELGKVHRVRLLLAEVSAGPCGAPPSESGREPAATDCARAPWTHRGTLGAARWMGSRLLCVQGPRWVVRRTHRATSLRRRLAPPGARAGLSPRSSCRSENGPALW